jgi:hypothetical protein
MESVDTTMSSAADVLDEALERFRGTGPEYGGGLANHGPMAAEALVAMGRTEAVPQWVEAYQPRGGDERRARHQVHGGLLPRRRGLAFPRVTRRRRGRLPPAALMGRLGAAW